MCSGAHSAEASAIRSWYQWSRPATISTPVPSGDEAWPVTRCTTTTAVTDGVDATASSTAGLSMAGTPRRKPPSAVTTTLAGRVVHTVDDRVRREATEDARVGRADPRAGEHGDRQLGDHRHVDADPVAALDAEGAQHVGEPAHLVVQLGVGDRAGVAGLALPVVGDLVAEPGVEVAVEAVVGDVELPAHEPLGEGQVPDQRLVEVPEPRHQLAGLAGPERHGSASASS